MAAISFVHINQDAQANNGNSLPGPVTASFSWAPVAGNTYILTTAARCSGSTPNPTLVTGNNQTWTLVKDLTTSEIAHGGTATGNRRLSYHCCQATSPTTGSLMFDWQTGPSGNLNITNFVCSIERIVGVNSGSNGLVSFGNFGQMILYQVQDGTIFGSMSNALQPNNATLAAGVINTSTGLSAGAGYTTLGNPGDSNDITIITEYRSPGFITSSVVVNTGGFTSNYAILLTEVGIFGTPTIWGVPIRTPPSSSGPPVMVIGGSGVPFFYTGSI